MYVIIEMNGIVEQLVDDICDLNVRRKIKWISFKDEYPEEPNIIATWTNDRSYIKIFVKSLENGYLLIDKKNGDVRPLMDKEKVIKWMTEQNIHCYWTELDLHYLMESTKNLI